MIDLLFESSLRSLLLAGSVGLFLASLRVDDPARRHTAWKVVLAGSIVMPFLVGGLPQLEVPILPAEIQTPVNANATVSTRTSGANGTLSGVISAPSGMSSDDVWVLLYLAVAFVFLLRIAVGYWTGIRLVRMAQPIDPRLIPQPFPRVRYRTSSRFTVPMTFGGIFPVVLLPPDFPDWNIAKRRAVLDHEHAHVRRRDFLTNLAASLARAVHWINPMAWWLERRLAALAEEAADDIAAGLDRRSYAAFLVEIAKSAGPNRTRAVAMARTSRLGKRIEHLSTGRTHLMKSTTGKRTLTLTLGILGLFLATSCMTPTRAGTGSSLVARPTQDTGLSEESARAMRNTREAQRTRLEQAAERLEQAAERRRPDPVAEQAEVERALASQLAEREALARAGRGVGTALILEYRRAQQRFEQVSTQLTERHPKYLEAQRRLAALEAELSLEVLEANARIERERAEAPSQEANERVEARLRELEYAQIITQQRDLAEGQEWFQNQIREAERRVNLARAELRASEERLRALIDQREAASPPEAPQPDVN